MLRLTTASAAPPDSTKPNKPPSPSIKLKGTNNVIPLHPHLQDDQHPIKTHRGAYRADPVLPAFTRRREHLVGRVASLGMACCVAGEIITAGAGPVVQLATELGLTYGDTLKLFGVFIASGLLGVLPVSSTWSIGNQFDVRRRGHTPAQSLPELLQHLRSQPLYDTLLSAAPSIRRFGLNKHNELLLGRLAMVLFSLELLSDALTRGGLFTRLGLLSEQPGLLHAPWWVLGLMGAWVAAALHGGSLDDGEQEEHDEGK